jgi:phosphoglycolate phosphatase
MIKYIVFDFDGTLVDSKAIFISVFNQLAEQYDFKKMEPDKIEYLQQLSLKERFRYLRVPLYKLPFLTAKFLKRYRQSIGHILLVPGMDHALQQLKNKGYSLGIVSTNNESNIRQFLLTNQIEDIDKIYCSSKLFGKDQVIKKFIKSCHLQSSEMIYVGDEQRDIIAARKNQVKAIWVSWGYDVAAVAQKENPDYMVSSPAEIVNIVASIS